MKKSRFTESKIIKILKEQEAGRSVSEICREYGIHLATFYNRQRPHDSLNGLTPERFLLKYGRNHTSDSKNREMDFLSKFGKQA